MNTTPRCITSTSDGVETDPGGLIAWVRASEGGMVNSALYVGSGQFGRGLMVDRPVAAGEVLARIPRCCMLVSSVATAEHPELEPLRKTIPPRGWALRLAVAWALESALGSASPLAPYIQTMPGGTHSADLCHPWVFDQESLAALQYGPVVRMMAAERRRLWECVDGAGIGAGIGIGDSDSFRDPGNNCLLSRGVGLAVSRALHSASSEVDTTAMVPLVDMCNHSFQPTATTEGSFDSFVELIATAPIPAGGDVLTLYNQFSNDDLMLKYGFVHPGNPREMTPMLIHMDVLMLAAHPAGVAPEQLSLTRRKARLLSGLKAHVATTRRQRPEEELHVLLALTPDGNGVEYVDVAADVAQKADSMVSAEMGGWLALLILFQDSDSLPGQEDGAAVRRAAWRVTQQLYELRLAGFPTTADEDRLLLSDRQSLTPSLRCAYEYRLEKKERLHGELMTVKKMIAEFRGDSSDGVWLEPDLRLPNSSRR
jgi:hypothetical protein